MAEQVNIGSISSIAKFIPLCQSGDQSHAKDFAQIRSLN